MKFSIDYDCLREYFNEVDVDRVLQAVRFYI